MTKFTHEWYDANKVPRSLSFFINRWMNAGNRWSNWFWFKLLMWSDSRWRRKRDY